MSGRTRRRLEAAVGLMALIGLTEVCGEYPIVNPNDSRYPVSITILGPDSAFSVGEELTFTVHTDPVWTGAPPSWESDWRFRSLGEGRFKVEWVRYGPQRGTIRARLGPHVAEHPVVVRQRVARIELLGAMDTLRLGPHEQEYQLQLRAFDALGAEIRELWSTQATFVSRDPDIIRIDGATAYSVGNGTTWIVAELDGVQDSIPASVR